MKKIPNLHYITQDRADKEHAQLAYEACVAGAKLIQLRLKRRPDQEVKSTALEISAICKKFGATFILNDYTYIAKEVEADGVHLGNTDMDHQQARSILGAEKIIGGTAYTVEEAAHHLKKGIVDYLGIGTFKPTQTKPEITNFLNLNDLKAVVNLKQQLGSHMQILVIGGIQLEDIKDLVSLGVNGIAVASLINKSENKKDTIAKINHLLGNSGQTIQQDFRSSIRPL